MRVSDTEESDWSRPTVAMTTRARSDRPYAPRVAQNIAATLPGQIPFVSRLAKKKKADILWVCTAHAKAPYVTARCLKNPEDSSRNKP
ncbi:hypothetical protein CDAR_321491 [Caerostris darwini]|uniref:Uncharacterized protein n=1 Tax=Caerostris darwini TaxID=1538125 RepID=A0AAV4U1L4_9ARAC|nr:hypothetical protein CDAR_321491 [Caerostris darwini]